ncbi:unnamed protein product [Nesidiocoris tenuis]|uniref:Uncharacterized protein n=1 Tax=Nesidiocoris tenuis TaxID=355587 RepID=A0A6H5GK39_9HEMI|nr:unnamed protein product [Nesidiocoris tenuis]
MLPLIGRSVDPRGFRATSNACRWRNLGKIRSPSSAHRHGEYQLVRIAIIEVDNRPAQAIAPYSSSSKPLVCVRVNIEFVARGKGWIGYSRFPQLKNAAGRRIWNHRARGAGKKSRPSGALGRLKRTTCAVRRRGTESEAELRASCANAGVTEKPKLKNLAFLLAHDRSRRDNSEIIPSFFHPLHQQIAHSGFREFPMHRQGFAGRMSRFRGNCWLGRFASLKRASGPPVQLEPVDLSMKSGTTPTSPVPALLPISKFIATRPSPQPPGNKNILDLCLPIR